jgi:predicted MPP superfamily phosphohydrolase
MFLIFAVFIVFLGSALLFGTHYFLYFSFIHFFGIAHGHLRYLLIAILLFFSTSFVISSFIAHIKDGLITRTYYFLSGLWLGFLTNFILASSLTWLFLLIFNLLKFNVDKAILGLSFFILAFLYSLYGLWNALHPRIKNIAVSIPDLPDFWKGKKIVQLSDIHLGHNNRIGFMKRIADKVNLIAPEMVVITGDLFDGMDGDLNYPLEPIKSISAPLGIFFITGNHETYLGVDKVYAALQNVPVIIMKDEVLDLNGLKLIGINYPEKIQGKSIAKELEARKNEFLDCPNILLYHSPVEIEKIAKAGVNLELCGHTHAGQFFPLNYITKLLYRGYDYGLHKIGDYTLYTTNGTGTWGPLMRTDHAPEIVAITLN